MPPKILCVEVDASLRDYRCAFLRASSYDTLSASPQLAEIVLRNHRFDLLVLSSLNERDLQRIGNFSDGAEVLVLDEFVTGAELLTLVAQRLNRQRRAQQERLWQQMTPEMYAELRHNPWVTCPQELELKQAYYAALSAQLLPCSSIAAWRYIKDSEQRQGGLNVISEYVERVVQRAGNLMYRHSVMLEFGSVLAKKESAIPSLHFPSTSRT